MALQSLRPPHELGDALRDHDGRHVGVGADDVGHDRGVGDAERFDAVDTALRIDNRHRIVRGADRAGRGRMEAGAGRVEDFVVRLITLEQLLQPAGLIAAPIIARRSGAGAASTAVAPMALAMPDSPVPLISFSGACRGIR